MSRSDADVPEPGAGGPLLWLFRAAFACALAVAVVVFVFFVWGLLDGSVSDFNAGPWLIVLVLLTAVPAIGWRLRARGRLGAAVLVLLVLALPGLLYALFVLLAVASGTSWN